MTGIPEKRSWTVDLVKKTMKELGMQGISEVNEDNYKDFAKKIRRKERTGQSSEEKTKSKKLHAEKLEEKGMIVRKSPRTHKTLFPDRFQIVSCKMIGNAKVCLRSDSSDDTFFITIASGEKRWKSLHFEKAYAKQVYDSIKNSNDISERIPLTSKEIVQAKLAEMKPGSKKRNVEGQVKHYREHDITPVYDTDGSFKYYKITKGNKYLGAKKNPTFAMELIDQLISSGVSSEQD